MSPGTVVCVALALGVGAWATVKKVSDRNELTTLRAKVQTLQQRADQAEAALAEVERLRAVGDELTRRLTAEQAARDAAYKERDDAIQRATTGGPCLRSTALRVLDGAPGIRVAGLPEAAAGAAAGGAAAAAAAGDAARAAADLAADDAPAQAAVTDTDAARWILQAGAMYETCRGRLHALIDFELQRAEHLAQRASPSTPSKSALP